MGEGQPGVSTKLLFFLALVFATGRAETALAADGQFSGNTTSTLSWRGDNANGEFDDDDFGVGILRNNFYWEGDQVGVFLRLDAEGFVNRPALPWLKNDVRVERFGVEWRLENASGTAAFRLSAGDFYAQFGNGLALSLRAVDEIGVDMAARGVRGDGSVLDDRVRFTALAGVSNPVNINGQTFQYTEDAEDVLTGGERKSTWEAAPLVPTGFGCAKPSRPCQGDVEPVPTRGRP